MLARLERNSKTRYQKGSICPTQSKPCLRIGSYSHPLYILERPVQIDSAAESSANKKSKVFATSLKPIEKVQGLQYLPCTSQLRVGWLPCQEALQCIISEYYQSTTSCDPPNQNQLNQTYPNMSGIEEKSRTWVVKLHKEPLNYSTEDVPVVESHLIAA